MPVENSGEEHPHRRKHRWPRRNRIKNGVLGISTFISAYRHEQQTNRQQEKREDRGKTLRDYLTLLFVVLTTVGIGIQACVLHSSDVTFEKTLISQKESSERQLRAYVLAVQARVINAFDDVPRAVVLIKNTGQTPAYGVKMVYRFDLVSYPLKPPASEIKFTGDEENGDLGPGTGQIIDLPLKPQGPLEENIKAALRAQKAAFFIYGEVRYSDTFGKDRSTTFRYIVGGSLPVGDGRAYLTKDGNKSD